MIYSNRQIEQILEENRQLKSETSRILAQVGKITNQVASLADKLSDLAPGSANSQWKRVADIPWFSDFFPEITTAIRFQIGRHLARISDRMGISIIVEEPHHYYHQAVINKLGHTLTESPNFMKFYRKQARPQIDYFDDDEEKYCDLDCANCYLDCEEAAI